MRITSNNQPTNQDVVLEIAPQTIAALTNPAINGSDYWNLSGAAQGSASFHAAWSYATGLGVTISLVDEGVNYTHLDLVDNYDTGIDFDPRDDIANYDARPDSTYEDHGTEVAGVIAGSAYNSFGTIGAAPDAKITASYLRYGSDFTIEDLGAIMAHQAAYDISNNSWGFTAAFADNFRDSFFDPLAEGMENAATAGRGGLGTALVFAAGNGKIDIDGVNVGDDSNFHSLSNSRFGIAVGAHDAEGQTAFFSSPGSNILLSAPGVGLLTTAGDDESARGSTYVSGTSFAAPMVSSAIALMLEVNPDLGYRDIQEILAISSDSSTGPGAVGNGARNINGGGLVFDREMGFGTLNAEAAVNLARTWTAQSTAANEAHIAAAFEAPEVADPSSQSISVEVTNPGTDGFSLDHVLLSLSVSDADLQDLRIELTSPDGTKALIAPNLIAAGNVTTLDFTFMSVATWGETPYGTWTLTLTHPSASPDFTVLGAQLDLYGDATGPDDTYYFTSSYGRLAAADAGRTTTTDDNGGIDRLNFVAAADAVWVDLSGLTASSVGHTALTLDGEFENVVGSVHNDRIIGSAGDNDLAGDYGNDNLIAGTGNDTLSGGAGNDRLSGDGGIDSLSGGNGDDLIRGGSGADRIDGGDGMDTASFFHAVTLDFVGDTTSGEALGDTYSSIERFSFGDGDDRFIGSATGADDTVYGNGGSDRLDGNNGNDWLDGGSGNDTMSGGRGNDTFVVNARGDRVLESSGGGTDTVRSSVNFQLGANVENLFLAGRAVTGTGNAAANVIVGNAANNQLSGAQGNDHLLGANGADRLYGGLGADVLTGGAGTDTFIFRARWESNLATHDTIVDFRHNVDRINLSAIDADSHGAGNNGFHFIGGHQFSHDGGELRVSHHGARTTISADITGDGHADLEIVLNGHVQLDRGDFIL